MSATGRKLNHEALAQLDDEISKDQIGTGDLSGGELPRDLFDEFVERTQSAATLLDLVRTVEMPRKQMAIPKVGVANRVLQEQTEGTAPSAFEDAVTGAVELDATRKTVIPYELTQEAVEDVVGGEAVADIILSHFEQQFATDVQDLLINGDTSSGNAFEAIVNGYLALADGAGTASNRIGSADTGSGQVDTMPEYVHEDGGGTSQSVNTEMFNNAIQAQEEKYRDPANQVFMMSKSQVQDYYFNLSSREDGLGVPILQGSSDVTPFDYDIVGLSNFPDDQALLTDPNNLIWGVHRNIEVDVIDESDEVLERDLFARYALRARWDAQIEELQAGTLVKSIKSP